MSKKHTSTKTLHGNALEIVFGENCLYDILEDESFGSHLWCTDAQVVKIARLYILELLYWKKKNVWK